MREPSVQCITTRSPGGERERELSKEVKPRIVIKSSHSSRQTQDDKFDRSSHAVTPSHRGGRRRKRQVLLNAMKTKCVGLRQGQLKGFVHAGTNPAKEEEPGTASAVPEDNKNKRDGQEGSSHDNSIRVDCLLMSAQHYVVTGSVGISAKVTHPTPIVVDTGSGYNVIRRDVLPVGWQKFVTANKDLPRLGDASGNALQVAHEVLLRVRFGNALYRVTFLVVEHLTCPVLVGTQFTNRHVEAIWCMRGKMQFTHDTLPIIGSGSADKPWRQEKATLVERATLESGETVATGDESSKLTKIRLTKPVTIPSHTQAKVQASTLLQGLIVTEPKHDVTEKYHVRVMNSVHEVDASLPFHVLVTNFSQVPRQLPKGMVIAYASRSPLAFISLQGGAAQELCGVHNIFVTSNTTAADPGALDSENVGDDDQAAANLASAMDSTALRAGATADVSVADATCASATVDPTAAIPGSKLDHLEPPQSQVIEPVVVEDMPRNDEDDLDEPRKESTTEDGAEKDWREKVDLSHLEDRSLRRRVLKILESHEPLLAGKLGTVGATQHRIELKPGTTPVRQPPYRAGPEKRELIREQIEYQLNAGVIEPAQSEWASPVLLAPKKDGTMRFCVDFSRLNAATVPDTYPLPRMDDCIDSLSEARVFSMLDALWG